ncbi:MULTISPECIES: myo-inosose-2 dehydratase [unclassified Mameliella]|uniref:myo-inosose-2 dehydratase n=1 Tax=unclassified Mameliella TaxID=2630630 RepID=UPI00273DE8AC|nr:MULTISPECIES: myo-inosose-2 dehydratase [unclassified Mameliella]
MIRYGTNPIAWANDDDQTLGAHIPTDQILSQAASIGFEGIEGGHRWPADPQALKDLLGSHGLVLPSAWYSLELCARSVEDEKTAIQPHLDMLKTNGCSVCIAAECSNTVHGSKETPVSQRPRLSADEMASYGAKLEEIAQFCADQGLTLVYHHHMGTIIESPEDIDGLMAATGPATHLLFDTGHCHFGGGDPAAVLARHAPRVRHFHAKNVRQDIMNQVRGEDLTFLEGVRRGVFTVPGDAEGAIDFAPCLQILSDTGYEGWLVIEAEQDPDLRDPMKYQTLGLTTLRETARATGLDRG